LDEIIVNLHSQKIHKKYTYTIPIPYFESYKSQHTTNIPSCFRIMLMDITEEPIDLDPDPNIPYTLRFLHKPSKARITAKKNEIVIYDSNSDISNPNPFKRTNVVGQRTLTISANFQFDTELIPNEPKLRIKTETNTQEEILFKIITAGNLKKSKLTIKLPDSGESSFSNSDLTLLQSDESQTTFLRPLLECKLCSVSTSHLTSHFNSDLHVNKTAKNHLYNQTSFEKLRPEKVYPNHGMISSTTLKPDSQNFPILNFNNNPIKVLKLYFFDTIENIDIRPTTKSTLSTKPDKDGFTVINIEKNRQVISPNNSDNTTNLPLEVVVNNPDDKPIETYLNVGLYISNKEKKSHIQFILKAEYRKSIPTTIGTKRATDMWNAQGSTPQKDSLNNPGSLPNVTFEKNFSRYLLNKLDQFTKVYKGKRQNATGKSLQEIMAETSAETLQSLSSEDKKVVSTQFMTICEPLYPRNFISKWTILAHCECNKNESDTRYLANIKILDVAPGQNGTTRVDLQVDSGDIRNAAIKATNDIFIRNDNLCIFGNLEEIHDNYCTVLTTACSNLKTGMAVMIRKRTNNHNLNVAVGALSLAAKHLDTFFPTNIPPPIPFEEREYFLQLNEEQKESVHKITNAPPGIPVIITGGAGCGKTQVLVEVSLRNLVQENTILIVSPTNSGAAKLFADILTHVNKFEELEERNIAKISVEGSPTSAKCANLPCLKHESGKTHKLPSKDFIRTQDLVIATPHVAQSLALMPNGIKPDIIIFDENGFTSEMETIIAISGFLQTKTLPTIVLAGDRLQLTSSARSIAGGHGNYDMSAMTRLLSLPEYDENPHLWCLLKRNYRTGKRIIAVMKSLIYHDNLLHANTYEGNIIVINISSNTKRKDPETSSHNPAEAVAALDAATQFKIRLPHHTCQVITYYRSQEVLLRQLLRPQSQPTTKTYVNIPISSCENSQGSESDIVILSPVLTTFKQHECQPVQNAWHACLRRLTVCLGRSRHHFVLVTEVLSAIHYRGFREVIQAAHSMGYLCADEKILKILEEKHNFNKTRNNTTPLPPGKIPQ
jgi:hypothetical protein